MNSQHHYRLAAATLAAHGWLGVLGVASAARALDRIRERRAQVATRHAIHQELGAEHPERFPSLTTPGQDAWTRKHVTPWMETTR